MDTSFFNESGKEDCSTSKKRRAVDDYIFVSEDINPINILVEILNKTNHCAKILDNLSREKIKMSSQFTVSPNEHFATLENVYPLSPAVKSGNLSVNTVNMRRKAVDYTIDSDFQINYVRDVNTPNAVAGVIGILAGAHTIFDIAQSLLPTGLIYSTLTKCFSTEPGVETEFTVTDEKSLKWMQSILGIEAPALTNGISVVTVNSNTDFTPTALNETGFSATLHFEFLTAQELRANQNVTGSWNMGPMKYQVQMDRSNSGLFYNAIGLPLSITNKNMGDYEAIAVKAVFDTGRDKLSGEYDMSDIYFTINN